MNSPQQFPGGGVRAPMAFDLQMAMTRLGKYLLEGSTVGFAAFFIPKHKPSLEEVVLISVVAAATFSVIDLFSGDSSTMAISARQGAGFGIGASMYGWPGPR